MLRTLWKWLAATFSVIVILLAIGIGLFRLLLPLVPQYHERIEAFASEAAGTPVRIAGIDARWGLRGPELRFRDAQLLTTDSREPLLSAETGSVILDLGALMRERRLRAGRVLLDGLRLEVNRDAGGRWQIGGRDLEPGGAELPRRLAVGLRNAQIVFRDDAEQVGPWLIDDVDLNVLLQNQHLSVDAVMQLPPELGGEFETSLEADGDFASLDTITWQAYLRGADLELAGWTGLMPKDRTTAGSGRGEVVVWLAMAGARLQQASVQLDLQDVALARNEETIRLLDTVKGHIEFDRNAAGWQASGRDIGIVSGGTAWPTSAFQIEQVGGDDKDGLMYASVDFVRLEDVLPLADWVPNEPVLTWLNRLEPRGVLENFSFRLIHELGQVGSYTLRSRFSDLGVNATGRVPGFERMRGNVRMDAFGGRLQLDPENVVVDLPEIIGRPVTTERLNGVIVWRRNAGGWRVVSDNIDLAHPAFHSSTSLELTLPAGDGAPSLDLRVDLDDVEVAGLRDLIPDPILKPRMRQWLKAALVGGKVPAATVEWSGALDDFPFDDGEGEFRVDADLQDVELAYAENWPAARGIAGNLSFRNASMTAGVSRADLSGNLVSSASVSIADLREAVLQLHVSADGMLDRLHSYLKATPVVKGANNPLNWVDFSGIGSTEVDLRLPLKRRLVGDVTVTVETESGEVALRGLEHRLEQVEGSLTFRNGEFSGSAITALVLGAPVVIDVAPGTLNTDEGPRKTTVATARGEISGQELSRLHASLASMLQGSAGYAATVSFPEQAANLPVSVEIASRLEGMAVNLPEPVAKPGAVARDILLTVLLPAGGVQTDLVYGDVGNARINWLRDETGPWVLDHGGIHFGPTPARLPAASGLAITGSARRLDAGGWLALNRGGESDRPAPISSAQLEAAQLDIFGQTLADANLSIDRNEREWLVQIDSPTVSGALFVPYAREQQPIVVNLERLYIGTGAADGEGTVDDDSVAEESGWDPREVPQMDVQADDFRLGDMKLGKLRAQLRSTAEGVAAEQFSTTAATFKVDGSGAWIVDQSAHRTSLDFKLQSTDVGPTLVDLGFDRSVEARDAEIDFAVNWPGPPGRQFKQQLNGDVSIRVGSGQLHTVEPGAGRVFGLFSFTALPRRLSLDFRDVFDAGFGFDYVQGDFELRDGHAFTTNLILEGPAAQVGIAGRAGLVARDYDQTAVVYGNFGAALPVAGVLAGGPVGGAAMLIFSELFKKPLQDMARVNYRISGSWDEPAIERVLASESAEGES